MQELPPELNAKIVASQKAIDDATMALTRGKMTAQEANSVAREAAKVATEVQRFKQQRTLQTAHNRSQIV